MGPIFLYTKSNEAGGDGMLNRQNYCDVKREEIHRLILSMLDHLKEMMSDVDYFLLHPTSEIKGRIKQNEEKVNTGEKKIEKTILEIISLEQLSTTEIRWLFSMNRIIRELERIGDQITNIMTIVDVFDINLLQPMVKDFFSYEKDMMIWLKEGIQDNHPEKLLDVITHDEYINYLNKETYQSLVDLIHKEVKLTESGLKMVIISRFLERIGDHLVNAARTYHNLLEHDSPAFF